MQYNEFTNLFRSINNDFSKALEFLHNRVGKHNTVLSLAAVIIVLAALSAKVNFFPGISGSREDNRQRLMPLECAAGWECQEHCGLRDWALLGEKLISPGEFDV